MSKSNDMASSTSNRAFIKSNTSQLPTANHDQNLLRIELTKLALAHKNLQKEMTDIKAENSSLKEELNKLQVENHVRGAIIQKSTQEIHNLQNKLKQVEIAKENQDEQFVTKILPQISMKLKNIKTDNQVNDDTTLKSSPKNEDSGFSAENLRNIIATSLSEGTKKEVTESLNKLTNDEIVKLQLYKKEIEENCTQRYIKDIENFRSIIERLKLDNTKLRSQASSNFVIANLKKAVQTLHKEKEALNQIVTDFHKENEFLRTQLNAKLSQNQQQTSVSNPEPNHQMLELIDSMKADNAKLKLIIGQKTNEIDILKKNLQEAKLVEEDYLNKINALQEQNNVLSESLTQYIKEIDMMKVPLKHLDTVDKISQLLSQENENLTVLLEQKMNEFNLIRAQSVDVKMLEGYKSTIENLKRENITLKNLLEAKTCGDEAIQSEQEKLKYKKDNLIQTLENENRKLKAELIEKTHQIDGLSFKVESLQGILADTKMDQNDVEKKLNRLNEEKEIIQKQSQKEPKNDELSKKYEEAVSRVKDLESENQKLLNDLTEKTKELSNLHNNQPNSIPVLRDSPGLSEIQRKTVKSNQSEQNIKEIQNKTTSENPQVDNKEYEKLRISLKNLIYEKEELKKIIAQKSCLIDSLTTEIKLQKTLSMQNQNSYSLKLPSDHQDPKDKLNKKMKEINMLASGVSGFSRSPNIDEISNNNFQLVQVMYHDLEIIDKMENKDFKKEETENVDSFQSMQANLILL